MGLFFKERITERQVALGILGATMQEVSNRWPQVQASMRHAFGADGEALVSDGTASVPLYLAALALEITVAHNIFSPEQASRVTAHMAAGLGDEDAHFIRAELAEYVRVSLEGLRLGVNPAKQVAQRLLWFWVGHRKCAFETATGTLDPLLITFTATTIMSFSGYMKRINDNYRIVQA